MQNVSRGCLRETDQGDTIEGPGSLCALHGGGEMEFPDTKMILTRHTLDIPVKIILFIVGKFTTLIYCIRTL